MAYDLPSISTSTSIASQWVVSSQLTAVHSVAFTVILVNSTFNTSWYISMSSLFAQRHSILLA